jgi:hypothetical protein
METLGSSLILLGILAFFFGFGDMCGTNKKVVVGSVAAIVAGVIINLIN